MTGQKIIVELSGDPGDRGDVRLSALIEQLDRIKTALAFAERAAGAGRGIYYRLVNLHHSRAALEFEPVDPDVDNDRSSAVVYAFRTRLNQIRQGRVPPDVSVDELEAYGGIAPDPERHIREVQITFDAPSILKAVETVPVTAEFNRQVTDLIGPEDLAWGTMTGQLEGVNLHQTNRFRLYPLVGPTRVNCTFTREARAQVINALDHYVEVSGLMHYRQREKFASAMTQVFSVELLDIEATRPHLRDLCGIAPKATMDLDVTEFVDALDEDW